MQAGALGEYLLRPPAVGPQGSDSDGEVLPKLSGHSGDVSGMHSIRIQTMSNISAEMLARGPVTKHRAEMGGQARARGAGPGCCRIQR